jgi:polyferredoxin
MQHVEPLLCNDGKMAGYTSAVSGQWLSKHVLATTDMNTTLQELCFLCGLCQDVISKRQVKSYISSKV